MFRLSRYKDYTPLWYDVAPLKQISRRNAIRILAVLAVVATSVSANIYLVYTLVKRWPTALDTYQHLNPYPIVNEDFLLTLSPPSPDENAVVTSIYTDSYATAVATLGHSLTRANTTARRLLFYLPESVSRQALCIATSTGFVPYPVPRIPPPHNGVGTHERFMDAYSKLNIWKLGDAGIKAVVHLDADTLVLRNFDELFSLPYTFAAVPDVYVGSHGFALDMNTGVIFARPDKSIFDEMLLKMQNATYDGIQADQTFLNAYFAANALRLPYAYNANLAIKKRKPDLWADLRSRTRIAHYTLVKPFVAEEDNAGVRNLRMDELEENVIRRMSEFDGAFEEELMDWLRIWRDTYKTYGNVLRECVEEATSVP